MIVMLIGDGCTTLGRRVGISDSTRIDADSAAVSGAATTSLPVRFAPVLAPDIEMRPRQKWCANGETKRRPFAGLR